jgi:hypothetical protein
VSRSKRVIPKADSGRLSRARLRATPALQRERSRRPRAASAAAPGSGTSTSSIVAPAARVYAAAIGGPVLEVTLDRSGRRRDGTGRKRESVAVHLDLEVSFASIATTLPPWIATSALPFATTLPATEPARISAEPASSRDEVARDGAAVEPRDRVIDRDEVRRRRAARAEHDGGRRAVAEVVRQERRRRPPV